jgi:hypothetical protein
VKTLAGGNGSLTIIGALCGLGGRDAEQADLCGGVEEG